MNASNHLRIAWIALTVLIFVCLTQGYIIYNKMYGSASNYSDGYDRDKVDELSSSWLDKFQRNPSQEAELFGHFFDQGFFSLQNNPFQEMKKLRQQMLDSIEKQHQSIFQNTWQNMFDDRPPMQNDLLSNQEMHFDTVEESDRYVVTIRIPDLSNNRLKIDVNENGISVNGQFSQIQEQNDSFANSIVRSEKHRSISRKIPLPINADHASAIIENKKDKIIIILPKDG